MTSLLNQKLLILQFEPHPNRMLCVGKRWGICAYLVYDPVWCHVFFLFETFNVRIQYEQQYYQQANFSR